MKPIYFDYAATTPVEDSVFEAMKPYFLNGDGQFGNAGSLHSFGQKARSVIDKSRIDIAKTIFANHREIIFTSSATEANNIVLRGVLKSFFKNSKNCGIIPKIIISSIEHPSVMETAKALADDGSIELVLLTVDENGIINTDDLKKNLDERTILVSVMWVNNETGSLQPVSEIVKIVSEFKNQIKNSNRYPLVHTDAVQAFNYFDLNVQRSGVDLMTISSHKIYGPKGAGALYVKNQESKIITPIITGGDQEYGLRSGTENVPAIVGFSKAAQIAYNDNQKESNRLFELTDSFFNLLKKEIPNIKINGPAILNKKSPHILNIHFPHHKNIGMTLDMAGVAISTGSACSQRYEKPSYVLRAMGFDEDHIAESVRFSFGRYTNLEEIKEAILRITKVTNKN
ncbi:MAG TPA: cysteine desulfurase family protein [Candidatus Paceibacterota bacterium]|nr:cysteine desulfurase family protein [Candidatus Paceibacterota bacterium]